MKIKSLKLKLGGLKGLMITYESMKTSEGASFVEEVKLSYRKPVQGELKFKFMDFVDLVKLVCNIKEGATVRVNAIENIDMKEEMFSINATVMCEGIERMYDISSPTLSAIDGIDGFAEAFESLKTMLELTSKYLSSNEKIDSRQILMDFQAERPGKLGDVSIDELSQEEQIEKATELLEKLGALVIIPEAATTLEDEVGEVVDDDISVIDESEEDPFSDSEKEKQEAESKKGKKLKVA